MAGIPKGRRSFSTCAAGIDAQGSIVAWETEMWLPTTVPGNRPLLGVDAAGIPGARPGRGPDFAEWRSALRGFQLAGGRALAEGDAAAAFESARARQDRQRFRGGKLHRRTGGGGGNGSGRVPPARADRSARHRVLKRAAEMIGWQPRPSPNPQRRAGQLAAGRGIAYMRYKQAENYVAIAMEVAVDRATGKINVRRVTCAHDCGLVVNPDGCATRSKAASCRRSAARCTKK